MNGELRAAVVGYGNIGPVHARAIASLSGARLAAVCDIDPKRLEAAAADLAASPGGLGDVALSADFSGLLASGVDVVHLCTPHYLHAPMAAQALRAGCHVLLEKPLALDLEEAEELESVWKASGKALGLCFQNRYRPSVIEAKRILDGGEYGGLLGIRAVVAWNRDAAYYSRGGAWKGRWATEGGGVLINQAIHSIDLVQWLGGGCSSAAGIGGNLGLAGAIEVEDTAVVAMRLSGGARGILFATNGYIEDAPVEIELVCEGARLRLAEGLRVEERGGSGRAAALAFLDDLAPVDAARAYWGGGHLALIADFYGCVRDGRPFALDPTEGKKTIAILDAVYAAIGRPKRRKP